MVGATNAAGPLLENLLNPKSWVEVASDFEVSRDRRDVDPHSSDLHCVDVSTHGKVNWVEEKCEQCTARFEKRRISRSRQVSVFF